MFGNTISLFLTVSLQGFGMSIINRTDNVPSLMNVWNGDNFVIVESMPSFNFVITGNNHTLT